VTGRSERGGWRDRGLAERRFTRCRVANLLAVALALLAVFVTVPGRAHTVGVSRGEYRAVPSGLEVSLSFARSELALLGGESRVLERVDVRSDTPCAGALTRTVALERDGVQLDATFRCADAAMLRVSLAPLLGELTRGHRHEAVMLPGGASTLLFEGHAELGVPSRTEVTAGSPVETPVTPRFAGFLGFVRLGIEHILTGYDHLVFLLALVVVGLGTKRTIVVASAFTLAHSLSLVISALGLWTPPSSLVEPAIALSVAYVGLENLLARSHERRAKLAFAFGLVHGFGFASALEGVHFRGLELASALAGFNLGVELGPLLVLALLLPLVALAVARPVFRRHTVRAVSAAVIALGALWFVERVAELA
jgi:hydrogenase/urease accessory protein HupE